MVKRVIMKRRVRKPALFKVVWTNRPVKLVQQGKQCSEVKWLDTGSYQAIPNAELEGLAKPD